MDNAVNYQYLGIKFKPSGSFQFAVGELFYKANKVWFAIRNVFYQHTKNGGQESFTDLYSLI